MASFPEIGCSRHASERSTLMDKPENAHGISCPIVLVYDIERGNNELANGISKPQANRSRDIRRTQIGEAGKENIDILAPGGGYIFDVGNCLDQCDPELVDVMFDTLRTYVVY